MRILHILDHSIPLQSGYTFRTLSILAEQRARGWETMHITTPKHTRPYRPVEEIDGWTFYRTPPVAVAAARLPVVREAALMRRVETRIGQVIAEARPDILHAHSPVLNALPAIRAGRKHGIPVVYEVRAFWEDAAASHGTGREGGLRASVRSLVRRQHRDVHAVDGISFDIGSGEIVGFLGPNGAGKTTTLKMLAGLLHPTSGEAVVLGHVPYRREREYLSRMTMVMGNRNQLQWDLPALDSFELNRAIYRIPPADFRRTRDEFIELLDLGGLVDKPVRNLSLGERMKVEIAGALLHRPQVLFLDEPTIGLDVTMQKRIRNFVAEYNRREGATVLLTSHYMADVEALCRRVIVIHHGRILFDGGLAELAARFSATKTIEVTLADGTADLSRYGEVLHAEDGRVSLRVTRFDAPSVTARLLRDQSVEDLTIEDPPIEDVIEQVFADALPAEAAG
jgi:ABC-2 type transport system ATP-binding protein